MMTTRRLLDATHLQRGCPVRFEDYRPVECAAPSPAAAAAHVDEHVGALQLHGRMVNPSQPVTERALSEGFASALVGGAASVAVDHRPGAPTGQAHQVAFLAAFGEPLVRERVAKLVWMNLRDAGGDAPLLDDLRDTGAGDLAAGAEPQVRASSHADAWRVRGCSGRVPGRSSRRTGRRAGVSLCP